MSNTEQIQLIFDRNRTGNAFKSSHRELLFKEKDSKRRHCYFFLDLITASFCYTADVTKLLRCAHHEIEKDKERYHVVGGWLTTT